MVAVALLVVPAPDPGSPLSAAWSSYHDRGKDGLGTPSEAQAERLFAVLGPTRARPTWPTSASPRTAGRPATWPGLAAVAEYRDAEDGRVTLMRWRGDLPLMAKGTEGGELAAYTWGRHTSYWWQGRRRRLVPGRHHRPEAAVRDRRAPGRGIAGHRPGLGC